jgi:hypothetical protein
MKLYVSSGENGNFDAVYKHWTANTDRCKKLPVEQQRMACTLAVHNVLIESLKCIIDMFLQLYIVYTILLMLAYECTFLMVNK